MKRLARWLAIFSLLSVLNFIRINSTKRLYLAFARFASLALSPLTLISGLIAAIVGWRERSKTLFLSGLMGSMLSGFYIQQATQNHDGIERAFGVGWQDDIEVAQKKYMLKRRSQWLLPAVPEARLTRDLAFWKVDGQDLLCDIWQPPAFIKPSGIALIFFHGGGWYYLHKGFLTGTFFKHLAAQGHVCMDVDYRTASQTDFAGIMGDVQRAIAWMKNHAQEYGVNPERIVLAGASAGGHMALLTAYAPDHEKLKPPDVTVDTSVHAVISYYGVVDVLDFYKTSQQYLNIDRSHPLLSQIIQMLNQVNSNFNFTSAPMMGHEMVQGLLGGTPDEQADFYDFVSIFNHVHKDCPPTLLVQGEYDMSVTASSVRRLADKLHAKGVMVIHNEIKFTDHAFDVFFPQISPSAKSALYDVERFLALLK